MERKFTGFFITLSGELLADVLGLPKDAVILKIIPSHSLEYAFDVVYTSKSKGLTIMEGSVVAKGEGNGI